MPIKYSAPRVFRRGFVNNITDKDFLVYFSSISILSLNRPKSFTISYFSEYLSLLEPRIKIKGSDMMSKNGKRRSFRAFLTRNGFYIAVVVCVMIAAVASYTAVSSILGNLRNENNNEQNQPTKPIVVPPVEPPVVEPPVVVPPSEPTGEDVDFVPVYAMPVSGGRITNPFSGEELVKNMTLNDWRTHNGVDIEVAEGTEVRAVYSGEVLRAGLDPLLGYYVEQELETGYTVIYANLKAALNVKAGDRISQGDLLGLVGTSSLLENGEKAHLHLEVKSGKTYIDPFSLLKVDDENSDD